MTPSRFSFDRTASAALLDALAEGGPLYGLCERRAARPFLLDVQIRKVTKGHIRQAGLYAGLSSILRVDESHGRFRLASHETYRRIGGFPKAWGEWMSGDDLIAVWPAVDEYIDTILNDETALPRLRNREGLVHAALAAGVDSSYRLIQREAAPAFANQAAKDSVMAEISHRIHAAVSSTGRTEPWWPGIRDGGTLQPLGSEADALGVDDRGRLLVIEAKPSDELKGIAWAPAQVLMYATLFAELAAHPDNRPLLQTMLDDRVACGLARPGGSLADPITTVPIVAIGAGDLSPVALERMSAVHDALAELWDLSDIEPLEVWFLDAQGNVAQRWLPSEGPPSDQAELVQQPSQSATGNPFVEAARGAASEWKATSGAVSTGARAEAPYRGIGRPFTYCLPVNHADENLLADGRLVALERFAAAGIPWHQGIGDGPSNHLLSSQVQCVNALAPLVDRPEALAELFRFVLPISQVLPFGATNGTSFDEQDHVVFEWNGVTDYLGERGGTAGTRGANSTSVDAAIRYRTDRGDIEVALIEWKYIEQYRGHRLSGGEDSMQVRHERYRPFFDDPDSPIRDDVVPYDALFAEPLYQLMRQQLLAWRMELAHDLGAERVRLLVVAPSLNHALSASYDPAIAASVGVPKGSGVHALWRRLLRRPDRFAVLDSASLVSDRSPLSAEFKHRYGHLAGSSTPDLRIERPTPDALRQAVGRAQMILERVSAEGGVLEQLAALDDQAVARLDPLLLRHCTIGSSPSVKTYDS